MDTITYEQPLNETLRLGLRLEYLFNQFHRYAKVSEANSSHHALVSLLRLIKVANRSDLKSKITQILNQQAHTFMQWKGLTEVNQQQLEIFLHQLNELIQDFDQQKRMLESLRRKAFLHQLMGHWNHPAGLCDFSSPIYALWKHQPSEIRTAHLDQWISEFSLLEKAIRLILQLTRDSAVKKTVDVLDGFYYQPLTQPTQLIQITLDASLNIFPEISVGKHYLSARFMQSEMRNTVTSRQLTQPVTFTLGCCRL